MRGLLAALRFLTIFPIPGTLGSQSEDLPAATPWFPIVGLLLGATSALAAVLCVLVLPPLVTSVLLVLLLLSYSGGLHLDGLADSADGFFSSRPKEQMLAIMRDSRIGAMGVIALVMVLLLKTASLATLDSRHLVTTVLLMPLAGRAAILLMMAALPYARAEGGLGSLFYTREMFRNALWGVSLLLAAALITSGFPGALQVVILCSVTWMLSLFCTNRIQGATGDTLGAACELGETVIALTSAALFADV